LTPDGPDPFDKNAPDAITDAQRDVLAAWLRDAGDRLALREWRIRVSTSEAERDAIASSYIQDNADETWVAVERGFFERPERQRRHSLAHELLHPHFYRVTRLADKLIERELGTRTEAVIMAAIGQVEEQSIDRLAWAVSEWLPEVPEA
jgi:hypothetical protein